jgi:hypothetical protein
MRRRAMGVVMRSPWLAAERVLRGLRPAVTQHVRSRPASLPGATPHHHLCLPGTAARNARHGARHLPVAAIGGEETTSPRRLAFPGDRVASTAAGQPVELRCAAIDRSPRGSMRSTRHAHAAPLIDALRRSAASADVPHMRRRRRPPGSARFGAAHLHRDVVARHASQISSMAPRPSVRRRFSSPIMVIRRGRRACSTGLFSATA